MPYANVLMIGTYAGGLAGMISVKDLYATGQGIPWKAFEVVPVHYSRYIVLGDGSRQGQGWKQAEWHLNGIRYTHWNALYTTYLTADNTQLYIRTLSEDNYTFQNYLVKAIRPEFPAQRDRDTNVVLDFNIQFIQMVQQ